MNTENSSKKNITKLGKLNPIYAIITCFGILTAIAIILTAVNVMNMSQEDPTAAPTENVQVSIDDDAILGDPNAPVTIVEFSDYGCPFCARHYSETMPSLMKEYIDTGKVKLVFRDFAFKGEKSQLLANAAECARPSKGDAGFYEIHDFIFENPGVSPADIVANAKTIGYGAEYAKCVENAEFLAEVQKDYADAQSYGVDSTPTFFVNGDKVVGAQSYETFAAIIESKLAE